MSSLFVFGFGYSASVLAKDLIESGWKVSGTCRNTHKYKEIKSLGVTPYVFEDNNPLENAKEILKDVTHVLISIPPSLSNADADIVLKNHYADLAAAPNIKWIGYLSTIGVYGNHDGMWIDESTIPTPLSMRSKKRLAAEGQWLAFGKLVGKPTQIFRLPGIYGEKRNQLEKLSAGKANHIIKKNQFFNRIHVNDIARTLRASMNKPNNGAIYNVVDNYPAPPQDVLAYCSELLGIALPPAINYDSIVNTKSSNKRSATANNSSTKNLSAMARSFYGESKKVRNDRIKRELGIKLQYPTYKEGLEDLLPTVVNNKNKVCCSY